MRNIIGANQGDDGVWNDGLESGALIFLKTGVHYVFNYQRWKSNTSVCPCSSKWEPSLIVADWSVMPAGHAVVLVVRGWCSTVSHPHHLLTTQAVYSEVHLDERQVRTFWQLRPLSKCLVGGCLTSLVGGCLTSLVVSRETGRISPSDYAVRPV